MAQGAQSHWECGARGEHLLSGTLFATLVRTTDCRRCYTVGSARLQVNQLGRFEVIVMAGWGLVPAQAEALKRAAASGDYHLLLGAGASRDSLSRVGSN